MNSKFKIISMGRVGTVAINRYLTEHPQVSLPPFQESSRVFVSPTENIGNLFVSNDQKIKRHGIVIHDALFFNKKYRKKMAIMNNIKVDAILHMVRNPYDMVKSWINHINACACMGIMGWDKIPATVESFYSHYPQHFHTMQAGFQCRNLYKNYKRTKVIDFQALKSENIESTMTDIHNFLGVDNSFQCNMLHDKQNTYTKELLQKGIDFRLNNEIIRMGMAPVDLFFHKEKNLKPWVIIHDTEKIYELCPTLPKLEGDLVFIPKNNQEYKRLSSKTRKMLNDGIKDIVGEVLPVWAKNAEQMSQDVAAIKLNQLSEADRTFVAKMMEEDLDIFYRYYPEFKTLWNL
jgi:hypothetical protein